MLYPNKIGNIKFGGLKNGLPQRFEKLHVTTTYKNGENFVEFPEFEGGTKQLNIILPFMEQMSSFETGLTSFIIINDKYKYYAKDIQGITYLFPYQPNFKRPTIPLPVINAGETKQWIEKLEMKDRGLLYAYIPTSMEPLQLLGNGTGVFLFKTESAFSIDEIKNTINLTHHSVPRLALYTLEVHTKLWETKNTQEVSYVRLLPPDLNSITLASHIENQYPEIVTYLSSIENNIYTSRLSAIKEAKSIEEITKLFGGKFVIKQDNIENQDFYKPRKKEETSSDLNDLSVKYNISQTIIKSIMKKVQDLQEVENIIQTYKTPAAIVKYLATI